MASHSIGVREGLIIGLLAHVQGIRLLLLHPWLLLHCLPGAFVAISSALSASCAIWAGSLILRLPPVRLVLPFDSILRCTCVVVFNISTLRIWASFSGRGFFAAYRTLSPSDAIALQRRTILHGLFAQLRHLLTTLLAGVGLIALLAGTAALWMPWLLAAGAALLGLNLRRLTPCDIADSPSKRQYMLQSLGCVALLAEGDLKPDLKGDLKPDLKPHLGSDAHHVHLESNRLDGAADGETLHGVPLVRVDALHLARGVPLSLVPRPSASSLGDAHIVGWTSGSTGKPKAMAVTNWRIAHWSRWRTFHMPASSFGTRAAMNLFWIWYWHIPLAMGRTLVITPSEHNIDVLSLLTYIEANGATYIDCLTPSQMQLIAELADTLPPSRTAFLKMSSVLLESV